MSTNLDKMNTNLSRDNKQGWSTFTWIIIFLPFIIYSIRNLRIIVPDYGSKFLGNIDLLNISNTINDSDSLNLLIKILGSILPIVSIFIFEIFSKSKTNLNSLYKTI